ncbi:MAG: hypothetical protein IM473_16540 [Microcystis sp. M015S2]|uniref:DNA methyltransferase n=1 Tax=unclassified Microcystis TaxID=2643300 RepID=UPI002584A0B6|nr:MULTISPECIES: DNA methyltransferase [unclassified Microcystis]MCA2711733.1 hypothetical protein [Microcystis sp. M025S2]MCA2743952.1 hypothetical protein [Microcystis sp. M015S2]MCA2757407.1 hypothetical protein [Microcystis sp. M145S2]
MSASSFDYRMIDPISGPIDPKKQGTLRHWGSHPYFTRRAWNVVQEYIKRFSQVGDVVLDPFGGSGVTAVEALVLKRKAIYSDINPMAGFICRNIAVSPVNIDDFRSAFDDIARNCQEKIEEVYRMSPEEAADLEIPYWYPQGVRLPKNADAESVENLFTKRQLFSLSLILNQIELITDPIIKDLMRFTFSATLNKTNLTFSSTRGRIESRGNSGIMHRYRYWIPPETIELNVWEQFEQKFKGTAKFKIETNTVIGDFYPENFSIFDFSATDLTGISSESVDYIYTDPPYGQHIAYLELSTMWNAWLGFEVSDNARELEVIEGGDLKKSKETYINLLSNSIREMFRVLKFDRWMSIVFAHKNPAYWDAIVKSAQEAGFEYVNSSVQHSTTPSLHKKKNPLTVLSGELVLNFRKVNNPKTIAISKVGIDILQIIKEVAEMTIVKSSGASTEDIYNALIPKLLENGLLTQVKKQIDDITPLLKEEFNFSELDHLWRIRTNTKIGCFIPLEDRIRFYLLDFLTAKKRQGKVATFDEIIFAVMPNLINGTTPSDQSILKVLEKLAYSADGRHWQLGQEEGLQLTLDLNIEPISSVLTGLDFPKQADKIPHDQIIYALAKIAIAVGLKPYIGKKEQSTGYWNGEAFKDISLEKLPIDKLGKWDRDKIQQIDLIWFNNLGDAVFAFEVETSTPITTGIDRFMELLKIYPELAGKLVLIVPPKRVNKLKKILKDSHYIGHPLYMENKLVYSFSNQIAEVYQKLSSSTKLELSAVFASIEFILKKPEI